MAIEVFNSGGSAELQAKTGITPTTASQTITPDSGYDGLSSVQINGMGSGTLNTPSVDSSGLVTASVGTSGFLDSGTSTTLQLSTQGATTITPSTSAQTAVASGKYTTGAVTVSAMSSGALSTPTVSSSGLITASVGTSGYLASGTSATRQLTTQGATTITPTTSSQTAVASGRYTTGAVTVAGDSNLVASNIKSGVSIFGVSGSLTTGYKFATITDIYKSGTYIYLTCTVPTTATIHSIVGSWWIDGTYGTGSSAYTFDALSVTISGTSTQVNFYTLSDGLLVTGLKTYYNSGTYIRITAGSCTFTGTASEVQDQIHGVYYTE